MPLGTDSRHTKNTCRGPFGDPSLQRKRYRWGQRPPDVRHDHPPFKTHVLRQRVSPGRGTAFFTESARQRWRTLWSGGGGWAPGRESGSGTQPLRAAHHPATLPLPSPSPRAVAPGSQEQLTPRGEGGTPTASLLLPAQAPSAFAITVVLTAWNALGSGSSFLISWKRLCGTRTISS